MFNLSKYIKRNCSTLDSKINQKFRESGGPSLYIQRVEALRNKNKVAQNVQIQTKNSEKIILKLFVRKVEAYTTQREFAPKLKLSSI